MRKRYLIVGVAVAGVVALVIAAAGLAKVGSSKSATVLPASSCSSLQYGGSGSPKFIVASDLPLQGSSRAQTIEMTKAIAYTFKQAGYKAGKYTVGYQSCDDSTAQAGSPDVWHLATMGSEADLARESARIDLRISNCS